MPIKVGSTLLGDLGGTVTAYQWNMKLTRHSESRLPNITQLKLQYFFFSLFFSKSHEDVEKMGVANYNAECRKIVMRYSSEWENIVTRMGRWIDFKNDYKTLYPWFMESVWSDTHKIFVGLFFSTAVHNTSECNKNSGLVVKVPESPSGLQNLP